MADDNSLTNHPLLGDAATGLPPLDQLDPEDTLLVKVWTHSEGVAHDPTDGSTPAIRFLSFRGLRPSGPGIQEWGQVHIALPASTLPALHRLLGEILEG